MTILMNKSLLFSPPGPLRKGRILVYYLCTIIRCRLCTDLVKIVRIGHCPTLKRPVYGCRFWWSVRVGWDTCPQSLMFIIMSIKCVDVERYQRFRDTDLVEALVCVLCMVAVRCVLPA